MVKVLDPLLLVIQCEYWGNNCYPIVIETSMYSVIPIHIIIHCTEIHQVH